MEDTTGSSAIAPETPDIDLDNLTEESLSKALGVKPEPEAVVEPAFDVKALDAIEEPKTEESISAANIDQLLAEVTPVMDGYQNFTKAFEGGNFEGVEQMLEQFAPEAHQAFMNHLYSKYIDKWTDRWVEEKEGKRDPRVNVLHNEVEKLKEALSLRAQQEQFQQTQAQLAQIAREYKTHVEGLFDKVNFSKSDRKWVTAEINNQIAADPRLVQAIRGGKFGGVAKVFKDVLVEYVGRDKVASATIANLRAAQEAKKPPIQGASLVETEGIPDDLNDVPKDKLDGWLDNQLARLKSKASRK